VFVRRRRPVNKLRLKFSKNGPIKFIGHLDVMRYFQKAIRRAEIDVKYTEGYSPHQVLSFAQPLSVGATSDGEYLDMTVNSMTSPEDIMEKLNGVMNEGIEILAIKELDPKEEKAMTLSGAARYRIGFRANSKPDFDWIKDFDKYLASDRLPAMKKTKSGEKEIDMKGMIYSYSSDENDQTVDMLLAMSSSATLKPTLLFEYFFKSLGKEFDPVWLDIHRIDIYRSGSDDKGSYIEPFITDDISERVYING
jgi:radical SAM-linked protein